MLTKDIFENKEQTDKKGLTSCLRAEPVRPRLPTRPISSGLVSMFIFALVSDA